MGNFRLRLREGAKFLAIGQYDVKARLQVACTSHLLLANVAADEPIPDYFRTKLERIIAKLTTKEWNVETVEGDRLRATLHRMHGETASKIALEIWTLYTEYEEYEHGNFMPPSA